jgi:hypothetical protein
MDTVRVEADFSEWVDLGSFITKPLLVLVKGCSCVMTGTPEAFSNRLSQALDPVPGACRASNGQ